MLPQTLALIDDDTHFLGAAANAMQAAGIAVRPFPDGSDLLTDDQVFTYDFYVVDLGLPGIDGVELIRLLRRRTSALVLALAARDEAPGVEEAVDAGADMYVEKPVSPQQLLLVVRALQRRAAMRAPGRTTWVLDLRNAQLITPEGQRVALGENDLALMRCFLEAEGGVVPRERIVGCLGRNSARMADNTLHATIYRLRKRIESATGELLPVQSEQRIGYVFRAPLKAA